MAFEEIDLSRRRALGSLGKIMLFGGGSLLFSSFFGCDKKNPVSPDSSGVRYEGDNYYGRYETLEDRTNENGELNVASNITGEHFEIRTLDESSGRGIPLDLRFYNDNAGNVIVSSIDPNLTYMPGIYTNGFQGLFGQNSFINILSWLKNANNFKNIFIKFLGDLPEYNKDHLLKTPGIIYDGDWSFNEAKNFVSVFSKLSFIVIPIFPGAAPVFVVAGISWGVSEEVDNFIDYINEEKGLDIDKNKKYEFYSIPALNLVFFLPKISNNTTRNIRDYYRLNQGDWWIYGDDYGNEVGIEVDRFKRINNLDIPVMRTTDGVESYRAFDRTFLRVFGEAIHNNTQNIDLIYSPPVTLGDDKLDVNKSYPNSFRELNSGLELSLECKWIGVESLTLPKGRFNDCWKSKEISDENEISRWYARNIGQVQVDYKGYKIKLKDYGSGGLPSGISSDKVDKDSARISLMLPIGQVL